jgi:uncharacterized protein (TIRG00374 family)
LFLAFRGIEIDEVLNSLSRASYSGVPLYLVLLVFFYWLKAIRWRLLLLPLHRFRAQQLTPSMMIGFMGNNVLPAHIGEFVRVLMLTRRYPLSKTGVFSTVMLERLLDMMAILAFLVLGAEMSGNDLPDWLRQGSLLVGSACLAALIAAMLFGLFPGFFMGIAARLAPRIPARLSTGLLSAMTSVSQALGLVRNPRVLLAIASISLLKWLLMAGMVYVSLRSFGLDLPFSASLLVLGVCALGVTVPSTPGFFGVIQLSFWVGLQFFGVDKVDAVASSVYYHLAQYVPVTAVGLYYLNREGLSLRQVRALSG